MQAQARLAALVEESRGLDPAKDAPRLREIYAEAAGLIDRAAQPKKWAAFRYMYGQVTEAVDPFASLAAYRESLPVWDPVADRTFWVSCNLAIGLLLPPFAKSPADHEEVIRCLEVAVEDHSFCASTLALFYAFRSLGDPVENWRQQLKYLRLAESLVEPSIDPVQWASLHNKVAVALAQEPNGDFVKGMDERLRSQQEALAVLAVLPRPNGSPAQRAWIRINVDLSETWNFRIGTDPLQDQANAEQHAREALNACSAATPVDLRAEAMMGLARILSGESADESRAREALLICDQADLFVDPKTHPVQFASIAKFRALAFYRLLLLGVPNTGVLNILDALVAAADTAYGCVDSETFSDHCRTVMFVAADALVRAGQPVRAIPYWERTLELSERALQQASSRAGRLEKIFALHDGWAVLGYCRLHAGQIEQAIAEIDRGKSRLWRLSVPLAPIESLRKLVPRGGAMLFPVFAPNGGAVAILTETRQDIAWLPAFGREALHQLLLGDAANVENASWISRYCFRNSNPAAWLATIDTVGAALYQELWLPVVDRLASLGIAGGVELLVFPQAGIGALPLHAAWRQSDAGRRWIVDDYALRYAPSLGSLLATAQPAGDPPLVATLISNPAGDLPCSSLEMSWVSGTLPPSQTALFSEAAATRKPVLDAIARSTLLHLCTHSVFRVDDPFQSSLLASDGLITIDELLPLLAGSPPREVVLSACETAMTPMWRRADEFLGFPTLFLEHGTRTVLATLWPVDDLAAAVLVGRFYREWRVANKTSAQALRAATLWLRDLTVADLSELLRILKREPGSAGAAAARLKSQLLASDPAAKPFSHPFYWAPFTIAGH